MYFSSGSVKGALRMGASVCAEAVEMAASEPSKTNILIVETAEGFISRGVDPLLKC